MSKEIILKSLKLKNFKGIKNLNIDFSKVTNIYGENATGKTSIADSFFWLLFDKDSKDRSKFNVQPLDENNNVIHMIDTEVMAVLEINSRTIELKKVLVEKWVKKRGEAQSEFKGTETSYYIDEVPVKQNEYKSKINEIIDENIFKLITNPLFFGVNIKWQDRREIVLKIVGDITSEKIISYNGNLRALQQLLNDKDIDTLRKSVNAKKKKLIDDKKSIPYRVDELNNSIHEYDYDELDSKKYELSAAIKSLEDSLITGNTINDEVLRNREKVYSLKNKLRDIEYKAKLEAEAPLKVIENEFRNVNFDLNSKISELAYREKEAIKLDEGIKKEESWKLELKKQWFEEDGKVFVFDESLCVCPTCNRTFEADDIEATRQRMLDNFNKNKDEKKASISRLGKERNSAIEDLNRRLLAIDLDSVKNEIETLKIKKEELEFQKLNYKPILNLDSNKEYTDTLQGIETLENELQLKSNQDSNTKEIQLKKRSLEIELESINRNLASKDQNKKTKARIAELLDEEKKLAQQIAQLEGQEFLCEEFIKTKVELLESSINAKFRYVSFKLFETQVNGGLSETCEALIDGVPFSNANTASQINAGLDIINALSDYYGVQAPIFIDNRESINEILTCNSQVVNLIVSKDKELRFQ